MRTVQSAEPRGLECDWSSVKPPPTSWSTLRNDPLLGWARVVVVETRTGLDPQPTLFQVAAQQLAGCFWILRVLGAVVLFDIQPDVQADLIHHAERTRGAGVELEHLVDFLWGGYPFGDHLETLSLHRRPHPIEDETGTLPARFE